MLILLALQRLDLHMDSFFGILLKKRAFISSYTIGLILVLIWSVPTGIYQIILAFRNGENAFGCNRTSQRNCPQLTASRAVLVTLEVVSWLLQICRYRFPRSFQSSTTMHRCLHGDSQLSRQTFGEEEGQGICRLTRQDRSQRIKKGAEVNETVHSWSSPMYSHNLCVLYEFQNDDKKK